MKASSRSIDYPKCDLVRKAVINVWQKMRPLTVSEALEREELSVACAWTNAHYSKLGWIFDLEPRLNEIVAPLINEEKFSEHRYYVIKGNDNRFHFQISAHTNRRYPPKPSGDGTFKVVVEDPASLVFSCHPNGSVVVIVNPHKSKWMTFGRDTHYVIGHYSSTNDLAGAAGSSLIRQHIILFLNLASVSLAASVPAKSSERLLAKLELKTNRYSRIYESKNDQRRAITEYELALGAGLATGLIASTLFPLVQSMGKEAGENAKNIDVHCKTQGAQNYELCLTSKDYDKELRISSVLSTANVVIFVALITFFVTGIMWRRLKSR